MSSRLQVGTCTLALTDMSAATASTVRLLRSVQLPVLFLAPYVKCLLARSTCRLTNHGDDLLHLQSTHHATCLAAAATAAVSLLLLPLLLLPLLLALRCAHPP
jgi:hypothetical protein